jgi:hypothetical protein
MSASLRYDRVVIAYHGCDAATAERLLAGEPFKPSRNDFDWLGWGAYFWEHGPDRAFRFALDQIRRNKVKEPAIVGALIQLGNCFDLLDTRFTADLAAAYEPWAERFRRLKIPLPVNGGGPPDHKLRRLDCAVLNWYLKVSAAKGARYDTVRCGFIEGGPVYEGSGISQETHIQIAVRNPACILGVFRPTKAAWRTTTSGSRQPPNSSHSGSSASSGSPA